MAKIHFTCFSHLTSHVSSCYHPPIKTSLINFHPQSLASGSCLTESPEPAPHLSNLLGVPPPDFFSYQDLLLRDISYARSFTPLGLSSTRNSWTSSVRVSLLHDFHLPMPQFTRRKFALLELLICQDLFDFTCHEFTQCFLVCQHLLNITATK